ncbi:hypothetical protein [Streptomyces sp. NPDC102476]|uniref:hypothetical protein n=1 Tax=Streptomyces sp. NPDC102476 TaxID=3366181 RepID=UPI0038016E5B
MGLGCPARTTVNQRAPDSRAVLPATAAVSILVGRPMGAHYVIGAMVRTAGMPAPSGSTATTPPPRRRAVSDCPA